jgi:fermentation-respiration switch protein FrsA (DUF1100 family)
MNVLGLLAALALQTTDTVPPVAAIESSYTIRNAGLELGGTLTTPRNATGPVPIVVIIAGSGPTDRNGNSLLGIRPNSYAQLAWRLAERGIASLRYDKRVLPATKGSVDITKLSLDDFAADARAAADSLARNSHFSKVLLLGHSEGSALALLAARGDPAISGVISVSGLGRTFGVVIREQLSHQFDSATLLRYDTAMAQYLRGETPKEIPPMMGPLFVPINQHFMTSLMAYDPPAAIRAVRQPVLIVQGGHDLQVTVADAERLKGARPDAQLVVVPMANHVLKQTAETTIAGQMPSYQSPAAPIMPEVVSAVADWILKAR